MSSTALPRLEAALLHLTDVDEHVAHALLRVGDRKTAPSAVRMTPWSPVWPPDSP